MDNWSTTVWSEQSQKDLQSHLISLRDEKYRQFHHKLIPTVASERFIGIRVPILRLLAQEIAKGDYRAYLRTVRHDYYEEVMLWGFVIGKIKVNSKNLSFDEWWTEIEAFVPFIDNWAICDCCVSGFKNIAANQAAVKSKLLAYLNSSAEYEVRFALVVLMDFFVDEEHIGEILTVCNRLHSEYYYVQMAMAWLLSVCYVKFEKETLDFLRDNELDDFTFNKTLQKIIESNRVSSEQKSMIRQMKR